MGNTGTAILDFGVFPGVSDASVGVTGQTSIQASSLVEAWVRPVSTSDHSDTEHMVETFRVFAASIQVGVGFTVYGFNTSQLNEPLLPAGLDPSAALGGVARGDTAPSLGGVGTRIYGTWTIAWAWV